MSNNDEQRIKTMDAKIFFPSNVRFGWFMTFVLSVATMYSYAMVAEQSFSIWIGAGAVTSGLITLFFPSLLSPLNKSWMLFGHLLGKIISPIVLGAIFFLIITPVALISLVLGRDELRLKRQALSSKSTYWVDRKSPSPKGDSFHNQF
jgi:hypothetical protein